MCLWITQRGIQYNYLTLCFLKIEYVTYNETQNSNKKEESQ